MSSSSEDSYSLEDVQGDLDVLRAVDDRVVEVIDSLESALHIFSEAIRIDLFAHQTRPTMSASYLVLLLVIFRGRRLP